MSEQGQREGFAGGGMAYVGAVLTRYGRLQMALKSFRRQTEWLWAYLDVESLACTAAWSAYAATDHFNCAFNEFRSRRPLDSGQFRRSNREGGVGRE